MTDYDVMLNEVRILGMDNKWSKMFVKKISDDEKAFSVNQAQCKWAIERGFFPGRTELYDLNEGNYRDYIPDYNYFMIHPMNHHFRIWVNDKLTLKYVLNTCELKDIMPDYYLYIENDGTYTYLMNCPSEVNKDENFLWNLLIDRKILAMKPNSGTSGGIGFIKLEWCDGEIFENNKKIDRDRFLEIKGIMRNYIVTEYVQQHRELVQIWPNSECTLRVIMCKMPGNTIYNTHAWRCVVSYARFGTKTNGGRVTYLLVELELDLILKRENLNNFV